jgi:tRNA (mo5U34)-methyltransferase
MTPEHLREGIARLGPWFHSIDLGAGLRTKTASVGREPADHPRPTWELVGECLPTDLAGKSVLDVGCNAGFYSVAAKQRGAARVLGVDAQRREIRQARFVRNALGLDIEFRRLSVYDLSKETVGSFDVTMALGLIYHLKHLVLALERLFEVTNELLILETAVLPESAELKLPRGFEKTYDERLRPVAYLENEGPAKEAVFNWFLPSVEATVAMLRTVGFEDVSLARRRGDRAVIVAKKPARAPDSRAPIWLESRLTLLEAPASVGRDMPYVVRVRAENRALATWLAAGVPPNGNGAVRLGAHLLDTEGEELDWEYGEAALTHDVPHGASTELELALFAPESAGAFDVEIDLLAENVAWFDDLGSKVLTHRLEVEDEEPAVPWFRELGARAALAGGGATVPAGFDELVSALERAFASSSDDAAIDAAFRAALGHHPDAAALPFHRRELTRRTGGRKRFYKSLLLRRAASDAPPAPPPAARLAALRERFTVSGAAPRAGESFPGESLVAEAVLVEGATLGDTAFVDLAFTRVLGRDVDEDGRGYYANRLARGEMNRPHFLRDLLWSAELRG